MELPVSQEPPNLRVTTEPPPEANRISMISQEHQEVAKPYSAESIAQSSESAPSVATSQLGMGCKLELTAQTKEDGVGEVVKIGEEEGQKRVSIQSLPIEMQQFTKSSMLHESQN